MKPDLAVRVRRHQQAGITSVDCAMTVFMTVILAAAVLPDFSAIISPSFQKVILPALICPVSFCVACHRKNR
jgi:hypothetical protein